MRCWRRGILFLKLVFLSLLGAEWWRGEAGVEQGGRRGREGEEVVGGGGGQGAVKQATLSGLSLPGGGEGRKGLLRWCAKKGLECLSVWAWRSGKE